MANLQIKGMDDDLYVESGRMAAAENRFHQPAIAVPVFCRTQSGTVVRSSAKCNGHPAY